MLTGTVGELRVGYVVAATMKAWSLSPQQVIGGPVGELVATIERADDVYSKLPVTSVWLHLGGESWWVWDSVSKGDNTPIVAGSNVEFECKGNPVIRVNHRSGHGTNQSCTNGRREAATVGR